MLIRIILFLFLMQLPVMSAAEELTNQADVKSFINEMSHKHHFKKTELDTLFNSVRVRPTVMQHIRQPLEKKPWYLYRLLFVTRQRVKNGVEFWEKNQVALEKAHQKYGVPPAIIVATIGIESKYGRETGSYRVIDALSSVAFSGSPRAPFFRRELEEFLLLSREKKADPLSLKGSYAGAMGSAQFMPDSYRRYAVSYSGRSHPDLYKNDEDVITSIANYYHAHGWHQDEPIAKPATLSRKAAKHNHSPRTLTLENYFTKENWQTYHNFDVIKKYNTSDLYAMAVFHLSQKIQDKKSRANAN